MPLMYGDDRTLYSDDAAWVFLRHYMGEWTLVAMNVRGEECNVEVQLPSMAKCGDLSVAVAIEGANVECKGEGKLGLTIPAYGYMIVNK